MLLIRQTPLSSKVPSLFGVLHRAFSRPPSPPHAFASTNVPILDGGVPLEEERFPWYQPELFYPARIGEVLAERYQIVGKLGYGGYSTVWLSRDLKLRFIPSLGALSVPYF